MRPHRGPGTGDRPFPDVVVGRRQLLGGVIFCAQADLFQVVWQDVGLRPRGLFSERQQPIRIAMMAITERQWCKARRVMGP